MRHAGSNPVVGIVIKEKLQELINTLPWTQIGKKFNVSDNAVRKWARKYELI